MYYIIDLRTETNSIVENLEFENEEDAIKWINDNGDATIFSITKILL